MIQYAHALPFRRSALALAILAAAGMQAAQAAPVFNEFSNNAQSDPNFLANQLIRNDSGITLQGNAQFQGNLDYSGDDGYGGYGGYGGVPFGADLSLFDDDGILQISPSDSGPADGNTYYGSASYFSDLDLDENGDAGGNFSLNGDGILLTSGVGTPPTTNTSSSFSGTASGQGDTGLDALLSAAGESSVTTDATVLAFEFDLDGTYNAVSFQYMFGTEEYPNYSNFNDLAAVFIDGRNVTVFPDGTALIVNSQTFANQLFTNDSGTLDIEYDGVSQAQSIIVPLTSGSHNIKIAVSDANDSVFDTGFFVADLHGLLIEDGVSPDDPVLPNPGDDTSDGFDLTINVGDGGIGIDPTTPIWIDPPVAVGYVVEVTNGPNFATITLPPGAVGTFGDGLFEVSWWDGSQYLSLGDTFTSGSLIDFLTLSDPNGISKFQVTGIEPSAMLDPTNSLAFPLGVTLVSAGLANLNMSPITTNVPEPGVLGLFGLGLAGLGVNWNRRKTRGGKRG